MEDSIDSDASPYIQQVLKNSKVLDILLALAGSIQVQSNCVLAQYLLAVKRLNCCDRSIPRRQYM